MAPRCKVRRFGATWRSTASSRSLISHHPDAGSSRGPRISGIGLGRNLVYSALSQVWSLAVVIITVPIVVHALGTQSYGLYVLATLLLGYTAFLDLGLTPAVVRSLATHHLAGDDSALEALNGTALSLLLGLGLIGGIIIALLTPQLSQHWLRVPLRLQSDAAFVLYLSAVGFALNMCLTVFGAIPQGLQRLDLFAMRSLVLTTVTGVAQITIVMPGGVRIACAGRPCAAASRLPGVDEARAGDGAADGDPGGDLQPPVTWGLARQRLRRRERRHPRGAGRRLRVGPGDGCPDAGRRRDRTCPLERRLCHRQRGDQPQPDHHPGPQAGRDRRRLCVADQRRHPGTGVRLHRAAAIRPGAAARHAAGCSDPAGARRPGPAGLRGAGRAEGPPAPHCPYGPFDWRRPVPGADRGVGRVGRPGTGGGPGAGGWRTCPPAGRPSPRLSSPRGRARAAERLAGGGAPATGRRPARATAGGGRPARVSEARAPRRAQCPRWPEPRP